MKFFLLDLTLLKKKLQLYKLKNCIIDTYLVESKKFSELFTYDKVVLELIELVWKTGIRENNSI